MSSRYNRKRCFPATVITAFAMLCKQKTAESKCVNLRKKKIDIEFISFTLFEESLLGLEVFSFLILGGGVEKMSESADRFRAINCLKWRTGDSGKLKYLK